MKSYIEALKLIQAEGRPHMDRTGVGTQSLFGRIHIYHDMQMGFPLLTCRRVVLRWVFEELKWFLSGSSNVKDLQAKGVDIWDEWADAETCARFGKQPGDLGHVYGPLWRAFEPARPNDTTNDQVLLLLRDMITTPNSRRLIVSGWNPNECRNVALPPCHTLWQCKIEDEDMSLSLYCRSIDMVLGYPFDVACYGMLLEMLAWVMGKRPKGLTVQIGDAHIYDNHKEVVADLLTRPLYDLCEVRFRPEGPAVGLDAHSKLRAIRDLQWEDVEHSNYKSGPRINAKVAV